MQWRLLDQLPQDDVRRVLAIGRRRTFRRAEVVFHRGDPADSLHIVEKGRFAVRIATPLGDTALLSVRGAGEAFGELAVLAEAGERRSATVSALEPGETLELRRTDFERLRGAHPRVNALLVALLAAEVRMLSDRLVEAFYVGADKRVVRRLLEVAALYGGGDDAVVPLAQRDLADLAGTSRATANRILREEEKKGIVRLGRASVAVVDAAALARRAR